MDYKPEHRVALLAMDSTDPNWPTLGYSDIGRRSSIGTYRRTHHLVRSSVCIRKPHGGLMSILPITAMARRNRERPQNCLTQRPHTRSAIFRSSRLGVVPSTLLASTAGQGEREQHQLARYGLLMPSSSCQDTSSPCHRGRPDEAHQHHTSTSSHGTPQRNYLEKRWSPPPLPAPARGAAGPRGRNCSRSRRHNLEHRFKLRA